jgi:hypothetical protein
MRLLTVVGSLLVAGVWPGPVDAQSLGTLARSSARVRGKAPVKVYTEADLYSARGRVNFVEIEETPQPEPQRLEPPLDLYGDLGFGDAGIEGGAERQPAEPTEEEARAQRLAELRKQVEVENKVIAVVQEAMQQAAAELNDLTSLTFGGRRAYLAKIMEDGQKELANSQQVLADLEEKARRDGFVLSR